MTLHCEVSGSGPDLVLLHGWGADVGIWSELVGELSPRFRLHAVDLPGYGASPTCNPYTLGGIAAALAEEMPRPCLVCGWSLGGQVALEWAGAAPKQVARIALIATTPSFVQRDDWPHAVPAAVLNGFSGELTADCAGAMKRFFSLQALGDEQAKRVATRLRHALFTRGTPDAGVLGQGLKILLETDLRERLAAIAQPALVVHGERDTLVPVAAGEYLSNALPKARLVTLRGAAHAPFVANAGTVCALLEDFLKES